MTKKDFQLIADTIKGMSWLTPADRQEVVYQFADRLQDANPSFDRTRFVQACEVTARRNRHDYHSDNSHQNDCRFCAMVEGDV